MIVIKGKKYVSERELRERDMKDPEFKKVYEALQPRFAIIRELARLRHKKKMTQKKLAEKLGTHQSAIARFESGSYDPSFKFVQNIAFALGKKIRIV